MSQISTPPEIARFDSPALALAEAFWPGPLTLVLPKAADCAVAELATAGLRHHRDPDPGLPGGRDTASCSAVQRPPPRPTCRATSRRPPPPMSPATFRGTDRPDRHGGPVAVGVEFDHYRLLRRADAAAARRPAPRRDRTRPWLLLRQPPVDAGHDGEQPLAPGMLASHYAPRARVRLEADRIEPGETSLAFGPGTIPGIDAASAALNLSESGDLAEAAANLFGYLRALDARGACTIAVMPIPDGGLGEAIGHRLRRAAVGRE